jgi:hypothetical protein
VFGFNLKNQKNQHAWEGMALNIGKLSLAGLFITGTFFICNAYAEKPETANSVSVLCSGLVPNF